MPGKQLTYELVTAPWPAALDRRFGEFTWEVPWDASNYGLLLGEERWNRFSDPVGVYWIEVSVSDGELARSWTGTVEVLARAQG